MQNVLIKRIERHSYLGGGGWVTYSVIGRTLQPLGRGYVYFYTTLAYMCLDLLCM